MDCVWSVWKRIPAVAKHRKNGFIGNVHLITFWMSYAKETWTSSRLWRMTCLLQSLKTSRSAPSMKQLGGYYKHFCETLKWNLCRPYPCHEVPTTSQNAAWIPFSQWIPRFLDQIKPTASCRLFPLPLKAVEAFESLKKTIEDTVVTAIDETNPIEVKMDESKVALAATQPEWKTCCLLLTNSSRQWTDASVEKEAQAIIEAVRHWRHFLTGIHFILKLTRNWCPTRLTNSTAER